MPRKINIKNKQNKDKNLYAYHSQTAKSRDKEKILKAGREKKTQTFR